MGDALIACECDTLSLLDLVLVSIVFLSHILTVAPSLPLNVRETSSSMNRVAKSGDFLPKKHKTGELKKVRE